MRFQFAFKHMDSSPALEDYARKKIAEKVDKYVTKPIDATITFSVDKLDHVSHCNINGGDGFHTQVEHRCSDMYGSIDHMVDKLDTQLKRHKEKLKNHKTKDSKKVLLAEMSRSDAEADPEAVDAEEIVKFEKARKTKK